MNNLFLYFYVVAFIFYFSAFLMDCVKLRKVMIIAGWAGLLANGAVLINLITTTGHLPVFNLFESMMSVSFVLTLLCLCFTMWSEKDIKVMRLIGVAKSEPLPEQGMEQVNILETVLDKGHKEFYKASCESILRKTVSEAYTGKRIDSEVAGGNERTEKNDAVNLSGCISKVVWVEVLLLFAVFFILPKIPAISRYDFNDFFVVCFFLFRVFFLSTVLFSSVFFFSSWHFSVSEQGKTENREIPYRSLRYDLGTIAFNMGRDFLLFGTVMFLISEYSGMIWCQNGWGDMWQWSDGHLQSVLIFFYLMLSFHIQEKKTNNHKIQSLVAGMSGLVALVFIIIRGLD